MQKKCNFNESNDIVEDWRLLMQKGPFERSYINRIPF